MPSSKDPEVNRQKAREWRLANPDRHLKANREWAARKRATDPVWAERQRALHKKQRDRRPPETKARIEAATKEWFEAHPGYNQQKQAESYRLHPSRHIFRRAKRRAKELGLPFLIQMEDVVIPEICPVLGIKMKLTARGSSRMEAPSLDRIIPALGYVPGNVCVISQGANRIKGNRSLDETRVIAEMLRRRLAETEAVIRYLERELA